MNQTDLLRNGQIKTVDCFDGRQVSTLSQDVLTGLSTTPKSLPPKHFYDDYGSELFERICLLPEYYPTRTELAILKDSAAEIAEITAARTLFELGSGSAHKAKILLDPLHQRGLLNNYLTIDVSGAALHATANDLSYPFPNLEIGCLVGDFTAHLQHASRSGPTLLALLGGTIGNFLPEQRYTLLEKLTAWMEQEDYLLLGTDLVKNPRIIESAYNDSAGVTAEFNRNVLSVINRELNADFDLNLFEHKAIFDEVNQWIEMRLIAIRDASFKVADLDLEVEFKAGEELLTEISAKFTRERLEREFSAAGLELVKWFTDADSNFALSLAKLV